MFDQAAESFSRISPPAEAMLKMEDHMQLFKMEGKLAMFCSPQFAKNLAIWFMDDYKQMRFAKNLAIWSASTGLSCPSSLLINLYRCHLVRLSCIKRGICWWKFPTSCSIVIRWVFRRGLLTGLLGASQLLHICLKKTLSSMSSFRISGMTVSVNGSLSLSSLMARILQSLVLRLKLIKPFLMFSLIYLNGLSHSGLAQG